MQCPVQVMPRCCAASVLLLLHGVRPILQGLPVAEEELQSAVVALWGRESTAAAARRCSGVFITPEVVLTAASCVISREPSTILEDAACAHGTADCPTLAPNDFEVLVSSALPERLQAAEVQAIEFRYSVPSLMPQVCAGAVCGDGWDIAALRVKQRCPRQRCVSPLPLSLTRVVAGEAVRLVGAGVDPTAATPAAGAPALRYHDGLLASVRANQSLLLPRPVAGVGGGLSGGPTGCSGDSGAPLLRYEASLESTTGAGAVERTPDDSGSYITGWNGAVPEAANAVEWDAGGGGGGGGGWAVVGIHTHATPGACSDEGALGGGDGARVWSVRVARCFLWRVLDVWGLLPTAGAPPSSPREHNSSLPPPPPPPPLSSDSVQWMTRRGVTRLAPVVRAECAASDHWPPELRSPSRSLPAAYARQLASSDERALSSDGELAVISPDGELATLPPVARPTHGASCYASPTHFCVHLLSELGRLRYSIDAGRGAVVGGRLQLQRMQPYSFQMVGIPDAHALVISDSETGPDRRHSTGIAGAYPAAGYDLFVFTPTFETPGALWYQSASTSGAGGPIHVANAAAEEPRSWPGGDPVRPPTPASLFFWDAQGATLYRWADSPPVPNASETGSGTEGGGALRLEALVHLPLASLARSALYNHTIVQFQLAYAEALKLAPVPPNATLVNGTNGTNATLVYTYDGRVVNATNLTEALAAFEATLPRMPVVPPQRLTSAVLRPSSSEVIWSTSDGHVFTGTLEALPAAAGPAEAQAVQTGGGSPRGPGAYRVEGARVLLAANASGDEASRHKLGLNSHADLGSLLYHDATTPPIEVELRRSPPRASSALSFYNETTGQQIDVPPPAWPEPDPSQWFDDDSPLTVDWQRQLLFWCQRSRRRILAAGLRSVRASDWTPRAPMSAWGPCCALCRPWGARMSPRRTEATRPCALLPAARRPCWRVRRAGSTGDHARHEHAVHRPHRRRGRWRPVLDRGIGALALPCPICAGQPHVRRRASQSAGLRRGTPAALAADPQRRGGAAGAHSRRPGRRLWQGPHRRPAAPRGARCRRRLEPRRLRQWRQAGAPVRSGDQRLRRDP